MLEQTIRLVTSETNVDGITLRFGPLGNKSHQKKYLEDMTKAAIAHGLNKEQQKELYQETFPDLDMMNFQGWKLESFALIYDMNLDRMQVAIFSREV